MQVIELLREISSRLSDQEPGFTFETWTKEQVIDALNAALRALARFTPDSFTNITTISLQEGDVQSSDCGKLLLLLGVYNQAGVFVAPLADLNTMNYYVMQRAQKNCKRFEEYPYAAEILTDNTIRIFPPLLHGSNYKIRAKCLSVPQVYDESAEVPIGLHIREAFQEFMLYYLYDIDSESVPNRGRSAVHWANAFTLLGIGNDRSTRS